MDTQQSKRGGRLFEEMRKEVKCKSMHMLSEKCIIYPSRLPLSKLQSIHEVNILRQWPNKLHD
uniref:Uncharacterized protein n=1 Tax=Rhizophora mucronata TaxID=61149 RepID=A0A2P2NDW4_RHIMU